MLEEGPVEQERPVQQDFGRGNAGQTWKVREKKVKEGKGVHERKG